MDQNFPTSFIPKKPIIKEQAVSPRPSLLLILVYLENILFPTIMDGVLGGLILLPVS